VETARPATAADAADLAALWSRAVAELDGQRGGRALAGALTRADLPAFLAAAVADPERLLVLGLIDDVPVGLASLWVDRARRQPIGQLELIYVEPPARQIGVASTMLALVEQRCRAWGLAGLDAPALPGNRPAKSFFETQGMMARLLVMHRAFDEGGHG